LNLNLNLNLEEQKQNLKQIEKQELPHSQKSEASSFPSSSEQRNESTSFPSFSAPLSLLEVVPIVLFVVALFMGKPNYNYNYDFHR
jgi:hypothetical protein